MQSQNFIMGLSDDEDFVMGPYLKNVGYSLYCFDINNRFEPLTITATPIINGGKKDNYYGCVSELKHANEVLYSFVSTVNDTANPPKNLQLFCANLQEANNKILQMPGFSGTIAKFVMDADMNDYLSNLKILYNKIQAQPMPRVYKFLELYQND